MTRNEHPAGQAGKIDAGNSDSLKNLEPLVTLMVKSLIEEDLHKAATEIAGSKDEGSHDVGSAPPNS